MKSSTFVDSNALRKSLLVGLTSLLASSCVLNADISDLASATDEVSDAFELSMQKSGASSPTTKVEMSEGSSLIFIVNITPVQKADVAIDLALTAKTSASDIAHRFGSYTTSATIPAGQSSVTITISSVDDSIYKPEPEDYDFSFTTSAKGAKKSNSTINIIVTDNDSIPTLSFSASSQSVSESLGTGSIAVSLSHPSAFSSTSNYSISSGSATGSGTDYTLASGTLTIPAGSTTGSISFTLNNDTLSEGNENFVVTLASPGSNNTLGSTTTHTVNIADDDSNPSISFALSGHAVAENGSPSTITVSLSAASGLDTTVIYSVTGGSATGSGTDYTLSGGTLTIPAGQTSGTISYTLNDDSTYEGDETVLVTISNPTNVSLGAITTHTITIQENEAALGNFTISGITGASNDSTADAVLSNNTTPIVNFGSSSGASSYDITIYASNGTTVVCATQNATSSPHSMSSCTLTAGTSYKAQVVSKVGVQTHGASNSMYDFAVNTSPTLGTGGNGPWYLMQNGSITVNAAWAASPTVGVASDADSDSVTFSAVGTPSLGAITNNGSNLVYTPNSNVTGRDTVTYTITDARGGIFTGTLAFHVMTAYTWTGTSSNTWDTTASNWCGTINANKNGCAGTTGVPGSGHAVIIDNTCVSSNCSPTTSGAISVASIALSSGGLSQGVSSTIATSGALTVSAGTFTGLSSNITVGGSFTQSGGAFTATSATLSVGANMTISSGTFTHNNGLVSLVANANKTIDVGSQELYSLTFTSTSASVVTVTGTVVVNRDLSVNQQGSSRINTGTITVKRNLTMTNLLNSGTATISLEGSTNRTVTCSGTGYFPHFVVNTSSGTTTTFSGTCSWAGNVTLTSGTLDFTTNSTTVLFGGWLTTNTTLNASALTQVDFHNFTLAPLSGSTTTTNLSGNINVLNNFSYGYGIASLHLHGTVRAHGTVSTTATNAFSSTGEIRFVSTSTQTLQCPSSSYYYPKLVFDNSGSGGVTSSAGTCRLSNGIEYVQGTVNLSSSTFSFEWSQDILMGGVTFGNVQFPTISNNVTVNLTQALTIGGSLSISSNFNLSGSTISVAGNISGTGNGGSTNITLNGTGTQNITKSGGTWPGSTFTINKASGSAVLTAALSLNNTLQNLNIASGTLDMAGYNLTVAGNITNSGTLQQGLSPSCGTVSQSGSYTGTAPTCP